MKVAIITCAAIIVAGGSYYLYLGSEAFRRELGDFVATGDDEGGPVRDDVRAIKRIAETVHWELASGSRQRAFFVPSQNGALVIYVHGAPGAAAGFHPVAAAMAQQGFGALVLDMPGYGESEGSRNWGAAYRESIRKAVDFAQQHESVDPGRIAGLGYSMGAHSMASAAAEDERLRAIVLLAGFTNLYDQLHIQFRRRVPGMGFFAMAAAYSRGLDVLSMDTQAAVSRLDDRPLLVISGTEDHAIPPHMARALAGSGANAELWLIEGAGHAGFAEIAGQAYYDRLSDFLSASLIDSASEPMPAAARPTREESHEPV